MTSQLEIQGRGGSTEPYRKKVVCAQETLQQQSSLSLGANGQGSCYSKAEARWLGYRVPVLLSLGVVCLEDRPRGCGVVMIGLGTKRRACTPDNINVKDTWDRTEKEQGRGRQRHKFR